MGVVVDELPKNLSTKVAETLRELGATEQRVEGKKAKKDKKSEKSYKEEKRQKDKKRASSPESDKPEKSEPKSSKKAHFFSKPAGKKLSTFLRTFTCCWFSRTLTISL